MNDGIVVGFSLWLFLLVFFWFECLVVGDRHEDE